VLGTFGYIRAESYEEVGRALADSTTDAAILAGGTDLLIDLRNRVCSPGLLIDIKGIAGLRSIEAEDPDAITIGAAVSLNSVIEHSAIRRRLAGLVEAAESIATYPLRNRATVVGNLCTASPAADMAPVLLALGAEVHVVGPSDGRTIPLADFFAGVKTTCLGVGDWVSDVRVPTASGVRTAFLKQQRIRGHDLAVVNVGGAFWPESGRLTIAVGSCAPTPVLFESVDGTSPAERRTARVLDGLESVVSPIDDVRGSAAYRWAVLRVLVRRIVDRLVDGASERPVDAKEAV